MRKTTSVEASPTQYYDRYFSIAAAKILPGEYFSTEKDMLIVTVLGSCISVCLRDAVAKVGGMNHFMLPETGEDVAAINGLPTRYGTYAMEVLINQLYKLGAQRHRLEAKIFGGGRVLGGMEYSDIGAKNAAFVQRFLDMERIPVLAQDILGVYPRKVYFFVQSGRVLVKKLRVVQNNTILERERNYEGDLQKRNQAGAVELFS